MLIHNVAVELDLVNGAIGVVKRLVCDLREEHVVQQSAAMASRYGVRATSTARTKSRKNGNDTFHDTTDATHMCLGRVSDGVAV